MKIFSLMLAVCLAAAPPSEAGDLKIVGETKYKPHSLVRLRAEGAEPKAALLWRVHPSKDVQRASSPRGVLEFAAHPGTFEVELLSIATAPDGALSVQEARATVTIESCTPVPPQPIPPGPQPPQPPPGGGGKLDPPAALGRIRFGSSGCTATVIGPRRPDGRWDVLTAAHCVSGVGARGEMTLKDGRKLRIRVVTHHRGPDCAWCVTEDPVEDLPYANLAEKDPEPGTKIWHAGYGVDKPGNREDGEIMGRVNGQGQLRMRLSVSSGDSGGGILRTDTNEVISTVCCTSGMGRAVSMWGAATEVIRRARPRPTRDVIQEDFDWTPVPIPERIDEEQRTPPANSCNGSIRPGVAPHAPHMTVAYRPARLPQAMLPERSEAAATPVQVSAPRCTDCSPRCECGCQLGEPCRCAAPSKTIPSSAVWYSTSPPVSSPVIVGQPLYYPSYQYHALPMSMGGASFGGACAGGG